MGVHPQFGSPIFKLVAKGLVTLHQLIKEGRDDSTESDAIRDLLDSPLTAMSETEKTRSQWLSEDLYSISDPDPASSQREMNPQAQGQFVEAFKAQERGEWDRALKLLRRWKDYISPSILSNLRGSIWFEAGVADVAAAFWGHAFELDPENGDYFSVYLLALDESGAELAVELARGALLNDNKSAPVVVAQAASILFKHSRTGSDVEVQSLYRHLIPILEGNLTKIERDEEVESRSHAYEMTAGLLGLCYEHLGRASEAVESYTRGIQMSLNNDALFVSRGILLYGSSPQAVTDFEQAIRIGSPLLWPYFFLAHHHLVSNRFEQCLAMCERGLQLSGSDTAKSYLEDWRAIAQCELEFPAGMVSAAFEAAIRLDPSNDQARENQAEYKASSSRHHRKWDKKSEVVVKLFGRAEYQSSIAA